MSSVLQSEIRLHEAILAALTLQASWSDRADRPLEQRALARRLEQAIARLKEAIQADQDRTRIAPRLLPLLFNLQEAIAGVKHSLQLLQTFAQIQKNGDEEHRQFLDSHVARLVEGIEWMEVLAEAWSLSLAPTLHAELEKRLIDEPRPAEQIRDWKAVFEEFNHNTQILD
jgi:hypothetical protein